MKCFWRPKPNCNLKSVWLSLCNASHPPPLRHPLDPPHLPAPLWLSPAPVHAHKFQTGQRSCKHTSVCQWDRFALDSVAQDHFHTLTAGLRDEHTDLATSPHSWTNFSFRKNNNKHMNGEKLMVKWTIETNNWVWHFLLSGLVHRPLWTSLQKGPTGVPISLPPHHCLLNWKKASLHLWNKFKEITRKMFLKNTKYGNPACRKRLHQTHYPGIH